jgi:hypothetical protein
MKVRFVVLFINLQLEAAVLVKVKAKQSHYRPG